MISLEFDLLSICICYPEQNVLLSFIFFHHALIDIRGKKKEMKNLESK